MRDALLTEDTSAVTSYRFGDSEIEKVTRVTTVPKPGQPREVSQQKTLSVAPRKAPASSNAFSNPGPGQDSEELRVSIYDRTMLGPLYVRSDFQQGIEDLVTRFTAAEPPPESLVRTAAR